MKSFTTLLYAAVLIFGLSTCKKDHNSPTGERLASFADSSFHYRVLYDGQRVSEVVTDSLNGKALSPAYHVVYTYGTNYIKASMSQYQGYFEFFFNDSKLPVQIISSYPGVSISMKFYYNINGQLDSVVKNSSWFKVKYIPVYNNGNIVTCYKLAGPSSYSDTATFKFSYSSTPNVLRATNPYLFIYIDPQTSDEIFLLPRLFSSGTIQSSTFDLQRGNGIETKNFVCILNSNGNLLFEDTGGAYPYQRWYKY